MLPVLGEAYVNSVCLFGVLNLQFPNPEHFQLFFSKPKRLLHILKYADKSFVTGHENTTSELLSLTVTNV